MTVKNTEHRRWDLAEQMAKKTPLAQAIQELRGFYVEWFEKDDGAFQHYWINTFGEEDD